MKELNNVFRIIALAVMFAIVLIQDIPYKRIFKNSMIQLYLAIFVILILILLDNVTGFILALSLLVLYFKIYNTELKSKKNQPINKNNNNKCILDKSGTCESYENIGSNQIEQHSQHSQQQHSPNYTLIPFVSEEHLLAAQNNIIDINNYSNEILGIKNGLYNEKVYGSQGFDNNNVHIKGFDDNVLGSLNYGLLE